MEFQTVSAIVNDSQISLYTGERRECIDRRIKFLLPVDNQKIDLEMAELNQLLYTFNLLSESRQIA